MNLGFIGLGAMGRPMALNLLGAGHALSVFARHPGRAQPLLEAGATPAASPFAVAQMVDVLFLNVSDDAEVESVLFGPQSAAAGLRGDSVVVDMGTTSPTATRRFAARLAEQGVAWLDAPVSGGEAGAKAATLSIMVGGSEATFTRVLPLFQVMGKHIVHVGDSGAGQVAKACNQIAVSATLLGVAEALTFARKQGVNADKVRSALLGGSAYSRILEVHGQRMLTHDFTPGFRARLHQKDMGIVLEEARQANVAVPSAALAGQMLNALVAAGAGELDSSALVTVLERLAGLEA
ncbi:MAG: NAD(P)-dependent oxidoreductase [Gallionellaceae bacterium]|nr:NAD(P)-dependent oxidoreductase [Gallionellaceae bacterium]